MQLGVKSSQRADPEFRRLLEIFIRELESFVFFHLGSDAEVAVDAQPETILVKVRHPRVHPFEFQLDRDELKELAEQVSRIESFLLDKLTVHRRSEGGL